MILKRQKEQSLLLLLQLLFLQVEVKPLVQKFNRWLLISKHNWLKKKIKLLI